MADSASALNFSLERRVRNLNRNVLNDECQRWALAHGFVQRCFAPTDDAENDSTVIPYPFTIYPSPFPQKEYERACRIQRGINQLVQRLAFNIDLMDSVFENFIECDPFVRRLRNIYDQIGQLPYKSVAEACIIRTDYMLQQMNALVERTNLRLIEINTIAVGLGAAAKLMRAWHEKFLRQMQCQIASQLPENESHDLIVDTLLESWNIYNNTRAIILFVVTDREFNIGDQMLIEGSLIAHSKSSVMIKHITLLDVSQNCSVDCKGTLFFGDVEVALVYYRTAYDPRHFYNEEIWQAYVMLESSRAIKCPSLRYHLAGMKCFQLALTKDNFLQTIFQGREQYIDDVRAITEEMFTIEQTIDDPVLRRRIVDNPESLYLKQNREGGGNVYCGPMLRERIDQIIADKHSKRATDTHENICERQIISELGIFGSLISQNGTVVYERTGGCLLRSKPATSVEGGIASGQGYIDSIYLI